MSITSTYLTQTAKAEFVANSYTTGPQMLPDVLHLSNGGYAVAYNNYSSTDGNVLVDFYDASSNHAQSSVSIPYNSLGGATGTPSLAQLTNNNVVVVWNDTDGANAGIKWATFTPSGQRINSEQTLVSGQNSEVHVEALANGGFVLAYARQNHIYLSELDASGHTSTWTTHIDTIAGASVFDLAATVLPNGRVVASWSSYVSGGTIQLHARVCYPDGTPISGEMTIDGLGHNDDSSIAALPNGNWAIAYEDTSWPNESGSSGVTLNIIRPHGESALAAGPVHVNTPGPKVDGQPAVAVLDNGFILVAWNREVFANQYDVHGRIYTPDGAPVTGDFLISSLAGNDTSPDVAALAAGKFVAAWTAALGGNQEIAATVKELVRSSTGDGANDVFTGDSLRDVVHTGAGNDTIDGRGGDDLIDGAAGNDSINGGAGDDTATYSGVRLQYHIAQLANGDLQITDIRPGSPDGTDVLHEVEHFAFSDGTVTAAALVAPPPSVHWSASTDIGTHPAGWQPSLTGDFNGDGTSDALWFNAATNNVDIWSIQNGQWAGSSDVGTHPAGWQPSAVGDFNGDGTDDVLWFNPANNNVEIWKMSNGHWAGSSDVGSHPAGYTVAGAGDFNNDGTSDVLWHNAATGDTEVWMLQDGHWSASADIGSHPAGWQPAGVGDFNHDGTSDVLWYNPTTNNAEVWMISNGHWASSVNLGAHPAGYEVAAVGDFAQDGASDVLWYNSSSGDVDLWKIADGHWAGSDNLGAHPGGFAPVGAGDFNHDGITDVLWGNAAGNLETWLLGNG
jgi:hypothetical protein